MNRKRILVAYDGSEESFRALEQAADAAQHSDAELGVVTVLPEVFDAPRDAMRYLRERGLDAALHAPVGDPATQIARVVDDGAYHTVYLGTRDRALAPSVSNHVARRAPVSVVIARGRNPNPTEGGPPCESDPSGRRLSSVSSRRSRRRFDGGSRESAVSSLGRRSAGRSRGAC